METSPLCFVDVSALAESCGFVEKGHSAPSAEPVTIPIRDNAFDWSRAA
jgi:hypothetical protein